MEDLLNLAEMLDSKARVLPPHDREFGWAVDLPTIGHYIEGNFQECYDWLLNCLYDSGYGDADLP